MALELRKTRFVCVSDTHNASPTDGAFKLPKGDVLIHAGDLTKQGTFAELKKTFDWIEQAEFEVKIVIAGMQPIPRTKLNVDQNNSCNHDISLDPDFYEQHGLYFHNQNPQDSQACLDLVQKYKSMTFLNHESAYIKLKKEDGPQTSFKVFGSPYSPANGLWAFGYPPEDSPKIWENKIPMDTDIVITHTPAKYHCDESRDRGAAGCEALRQKLWRLRPSLAICGHVHEGRGVERINWDLEAPNVKYKESSTAYWVDPGLGNKKQSLVDLSSKSPAPLANSGSWSNEDMPVTSTCVLAKSSPSLPRWREKERPSFTDESAMQGLMASQSDNVRGQGGNPPSGRCDMEALAGRQGRKETCIINATIMASSWPYKSDKNRQYNKPIVVDLDLPVWQQKEGSIISDQDFSSGEKTTSSLSA